MFGCVISKISKQNTEKEGNFMIGSGLKKLALEYGMRVDRGVAYGSMQGFAATMCEGSGWKRIVFATQFADPVQKTMFMDAVGAVNMQKEYRVNNFNVAQDGILVQFFDNPGTMAKIKAFLAWFLPMLRQYQASAYHVCTECGGEVTNGKWMLINGVAFYMHDSCAMKAIQDVQGENARRSQEDTGSYLTGTIGAILGAMLGAVVWAVVLMGGYVASLVGLLIGWLSDKGYRLAHGRNGKGKIAILIVAIILGVVFGTFGADVITVVQMIGAGEMEGVTYGDIPLVIGLTFAGEPEYRSAVLSNIGMGLLFAALGVYWLVIRAGKEVAGEKIVELK